MCRIQYWVWIDVPLTGVRELSLHQGDTSPPSALKYIAVLSIYKLADCHVELLKMQKIPGGSGSLRRRNVACFRSKPFLPPSISLDVLFISDFQDPRFSCTFNYQRLMISAPPLLKKLRVPSFKWPERESAGFPLQWNRTGWGVGRNKEVRIVG